MRTRRKRAAIIPIITNGSKKASGDGTSFAAGVSAGPHTERGTKLR
jgi:hypothetical protein